jgi:hypothetical protein
MLTGLFKAVYDARVFLTLFGGSCGWLRRMEEYYDAEERSCVTEWFFEEA